MPQTKITREFQDFLVRATEILVTKRPEVFEQIYLASRCDLPVLIYGPTGTGKELIAGLIRDNGKRSPDRFLSINCAFYPRDLLYSELFGHMKGAFTGADHTKKGLFARANGGTVFLDEIGDLPPDAQSGLLRFLETGEVMPLGSEQPPVRTDVRIVAATSKNVFDARDFRPDLLYRIRSILITTERLSHVMSSQVMLPLLRKYLKPFDFESMDFHFLAFCLVNEWRGNVRELGAFCTYAAHRSLGSTIRLFPAVTEFYPLAEQLDEKLERYFELNRPIFCKPEEYACRLDEDLPGYLAYGVSVELRKYLEFLYFLQVGETSDNKPISGIYRFLAQMSDDGSTVIEPTILSSMRIGSKPIKFLGLLRLEGIPKQVTILHYGNLLIDDLPDLGVKLGKKSKPPRYGGADRRSISQLAVQISLNYFGFRQSVRTSSEEQSPRKAIDRYRDAKEDFDRQFFRRLFSKYGQYTDNRIAKMTGLSDKTIKVKRKQYGSE